MRIIIVTIGVLLTLSLCLSAQDEAAQSKDFYADIKPYLHHDFCAVAVIHPNRITRSPLGQSVPLTKLTAAILQQTGLDAKRIVQIADPARVRRLTLLAEPFPGGNVAFFPAAIVEFLEDTPGHEALRAVWPNSRPSRDDEQLIVGMNSIAETPIHGYIAGPRTILIAPEPTLKKMRSKFRAARNPLPRQLGTRFVESEVVVEYSSSPALARLLDLSGQTAAQLRSDPETDDVIKMMLLDVQSVSLHLQLRRAQSVHASITCDGPSTAAKFKEMLTGGVDMVLSMSDQELVDDWPEPLRKEAAAATKDVLRATRFEQQGATIEMKLAIPASTLRLARSSAAHFASKAPDIVFGIADFAGLWQIKYSNDVTRRYKIHKDGTVRFKGEVYKLQQTAHGVMLNLPRFMQRELLSLRDGKLHVKHFNLNPKYAKQTEFPDKPTITAVGAKADFSAFAGTWQVNYANNGKRTYKIDKHGDVVMGGKRYWLGQTEHGVRLVLYDGQAMELFSLRDGKLHVKLFNLTPKFAKETQYPNKPTTTGIGSKVP